MIEASEGTNQVPGPGPDTRDGAAESSRVFHPGALARRNWALILVVTAVVAGMLLVVVKALPVSATATSRVRMVGTGAQLDGVQVNPEEAREDLIVDLGSTAVVERAAAEAGANPDTVTVVVTSPRETLFVDVAVTAEDSETAIAIANAIPTIVGDRRRDRSRETAQATVRELRRQADRVLSEAEALEADFPTDPESEVPPSFRAQQERNALVTQYATLISQAFDIDRRAASPSTGFEITSPATGISRRLPPGPDQTVPLALLVGAIAGFGVVAVRDLTGGTLYREHLRDEASTRHLGLLRWTGRRLRADDVESVATRLRALPPFAHPKGLLVAVMTLGRGRDVGLVTASRLAAALAESGLVAAVLAAELTEDVDADLTAPRGTMQVELDTGSTGPEILHRLRRSGGSALAAAYAPGTPVRIDAARAQHDVTLLEPSRAGVDVASWLTSVVVPDFVLLVLVEGTTTTSEATRVTAQLRQAGLPSVTVMVERQPWYATDGQRPGDAVEVPSLPGATIVARASGPR